MYNKPCPFDPPVTPKRKESLDWGLQGVPPAWAESTRPEYHSRPYAMHILKQCFGPTVTWPYKQYITGSYQFCNLYPYNLTCLCLDAPKEWPNYPVFQGCGVVESVSIIIHEPFMWELASELDSENWLTTTLFHTIAIHLNVRYFRCRFLLY